MNKKILFLLGLIYIFCIPEKVYSRCNFKTAEYIEELSIPSNIKDIKVSISNSRKFVVNSAKILLSEQKNIDSKYKKNIKLIFESIILLAIANIKLKLGKMEIIKII